MERRFLVASIVILGLLTFLIFRPFLDWVILGFLFSYMLYGAYRRVLRWVRRPAIAAGLMLLATLVTFFVPFFFIVSVLVRDVSQFAGVLGQVRVEDLIAQFLQTVFHSLGVQAEPEGIEATAAGLASAVRSQLAGALASFASTLLSVALNVTLGLFIFGFTLYYGFIDGPRFVQSARNLIPLHEAEKKELLGQITAVTNAVFVGHILIALIQAALGTVGFLVLGVPNTFFWGFVMLVLAIIPVVGPFLVWVPIGLYLLAVDTPVDGLFSDSSTFAGIGVLLVVGPIVSTIDNILRPKLVGSRADIHPFLVLIGALGGIFVLGFTGFVVGPLVLALFVAVLRVFREHWDIVEPKLAKTVGVRASRRRRKTART